MDNKYYFYGVEMSEEDVNRFEDFLRSGMDWKDIKEKLNEYQEKQREAV